MSVCTISPCLGIQVAKTGIFLSWLLLLLLLPSSTLGSGGVGQFNTKFLSDGRRKGRTEWGLPSPPFPLRSAQSNFETKLETHRRCNVNRRNPRKPPRCEIAMTSSYLRSSHCLFVYKTPLADMALSDDAQASPTPHSRLTRLPLPTAVGRTCPTP